MDDAPGAMPFASPVTAASRPCRTAGVAYTEVVDQHVLCDTTTATLHVLSPAAAAVWAALDGRSVRELALLFDGATVNDLVEAVRRLRTLGLIGEDDDRSPGAHPSIDDYDPRFTSPVRLRGHTVDADQGLVLVLDPDTADVVVLEPRPPRVLDTPVVALRTEHRTTSRSAEEVALRAVDPLDALRVLVSATHPDDLIVPNMVDILADVAEALTQHPG